MRISVTDLESYRYYRDSDEMALEDFLRRMRREEPPTEQMMAGRALHSILEDAKPGSVDAAKRDGFDFLFDAECHVPLTPIRELKGEMEIQTPIGLVTLVGVVDGLEAGIADHKLTARFDAERYGDSYQWRCYLVMFGGHQFIYNVFVGREVEPRVWAITEFHRFPVYAYPEMRDDVEREVGEFAAFLAKAMPEKLKAAA